MRKGLLGFGIGIICTGLIALAQSGGFETDFSRLWSIVGTTMTARKSSTVIGATDNPVTVHGNADSSLYVRYGITRDSVVMLDGTGELTDNWNTGGFRITGLDRIETDSVISEGVIRGSSSLWWRAVSVDATISAHGASGATFVAPDANTLGGHRLDAVGEKLYFNHSVTSVYDGESDLQFKVTFEVNVDNTGGGNDDTVDLKVICYYKGHEEITNKTQTIEVATTVGKSPRYKRFNVTFTIDWDAVGNIVEAADKISVTLNLETDTSEVDDIIVNVIMFRYKTSKVNIEV